MSTMAAPTGRRISHFRDDAARTRYFRAYDDALAAWPAPPEQLDVETAFGTTHVHRCGAPTGTPIVLLHAVAVSSPGWYASVGALAARYPVYAIDTITDAGRSSQSAPVPDADGSSQWLDEVLAALDSGAVHLVGLSYGAWMALNHACRRPARLASVVAIDPPGALARGSARTALSMVPDAAMAKFARSDAALRRMLRRLNNGTLPDPPIVELAIAGLRTFVVRAPYPRRLADDQLRSVGVPTLLLLGGCSPVANAEVAAERARRLVPDIDVEIVADAGHAFPMQYPARFAERVLAFVERER
jgi:pimeloyl-ACP methyl ester carboxylesterase